MPEPTISPAARVAALPPGGRLLLAALLAALAGCGKTAPTPPLGTLLIVPTTDTIAVGGTRVFNVVATDLQGQVVSNPVVSWTSGDAAVMTVNTVGRVDALSEGNTLLFASSGGMTDTASISVFTTTGWYVQRSGAGIGEGPLNGVFVNGDARTGWAVGSGGRAYKTTDAGATWTLKPTGSSFNLNAVWFTDLSEGWAVGTNGTVLRSTDGGESWEEFPGLYEDVHRLMIHPTDAKFLYAVTGRGLYTGPERGAAWEQWTRREDDIGGYPDGFVFRPSDPKLIFMTAAHDAPGTWRNTHFAGARISRSKDGGRSWEILKNGLPDRLQASIEAFCLEEAGTATSIYAATTAGEIFCSEDLGDSWKVIVKGLAPISKAGHYRALVQAA